MTKPSRSELYAASAAIAAIGAALVMLCPSSLAQEDPARDAGEMLRLMAGADHATYRARQLVVYFGTPQSAAMLDLRSSATEHSVRAESGDGVMRLWRRGDLGIVSSGRESVSDSSAPSVPLRPADVLAKYEIQVEDLQRILGLEVVPLVFVRRSDRTTVERLWVEPRSGIVYRRELYGAAGKLVGMSTIIDMDWGGSGDAERVETSAVAPSRVEEVVSSEAPPMLPHGYRLLGTYRMRMPGKPADHWVYTDGLHALSVFRTSGGISAPAGFVRTELDGAPAWTGPGPGTWAWEGGGRSGVVVAEEPALDPARLTEQLPKGGPTVWARLGSVWARAFHAIGGLFT